MNIRE
jgi:hypothetical protein